MVKRSSDRCRKRKLTSAEKEDDTSVDLPIIHQITVDPWVEDLSRPSNSHKRKVTLPPYFDKICILSIKTTHIFPWSKTGSCVDGDFWLTLLGCCNSRWLTDKHLDIWCDLMWYFRQPDADWAIADPYFCPLVMEFKDVPFWPAIRVKYLIP
ncbi:hypothetical protein Tco_1098619 [Tanacetum coccineum]